MVPIVLHTMIAVTNSDRFEEPSKLFGWPLKYKHSAARTMEGGVSAHVGWFECGPLRIYSTEYSSSSKTAITTMAEAEEEDKEE